MYNTLEEKKSVFNQTTVNTEKELDNLVAQLENIENLRFRGVCEAKFTMMTSLQRKCHPKMRGKQKEYESMLLYRVKNDPAVIDYFKKKGILINDISCMALMQHMGLPTPLLDFSTSIHIALAFAADGADKNEGKVETDDYASLYLFDKKYEHELGGYPVQQIYSHGLETGEQQLQDFLNQNPGLNVDDMILRDINEYVKWDDLKNIEIAFIEHQPIAPAVVTKTGQSLDLSNPNLDNQMGCFIVNLYDEKMPMEENWNQRSDENSNRLWKTGCEKLPFSGVMTRDKLSSYDIRKDVILSWVAKQNIKLYDESDETIAIKDILKKIEEALNDEIGK